MHIYGASTQFAHLGYHLVGQILGIFTVPPLICPSQGIILKSTFYAYFLDVHLSSTDGLEVHVGAVEGSVWWPNCSQMASGGLFWIVLGSGGSMDNGS